MKFSTREDIEAPIDYVFDRVTDFENFERRALRQGAQVNRRQDGPVRIGSTWDIAFKFRGRDRKIAAELVKYDRPQELEVDSNSEGLNAVTQVSLVALSATRTRVLVSFDMRAKTLTAKLLLQSLKLAKAKISKRFKSRVQEYGEDIEDRYRHDA